MTPCCSPGVLRSRLAMFRESPNVVLVACPNCRAEYAITRDDRLARRAGPNAPWYYVPDAELAAGALPSAACPAGLRGAIKGLQKRAGLDDTAYRALLRECAGVTSSLELDAAGAERVADRLKALVHA